MDTTRATRTRTFFDLHIPGDPLVLYNIWDAGSAKVVTEAGAKALATGSASVAGAQGHDDAESLPIDFAIANLRRIAETVDLPVTLDFEGVYAVDPGEAAANVLRVADAGGVGINFEDQIVNGEGLHSIADQSARIAAIRAAVGAEFFINARTDIFLKTGADGHTRAMIDEAAERARAYAQAGASGFFAPGLKDEGLIAAMAEASPLPLNIMDYPGVPAKDRLAALGVARISHGPFPWRKAMAALAEEAKEALA